MDRRWKGGEEGAGAVARGGAIVMFTRARFFRFEARSRRAPVVRRAKSRLDAGQGESNTWAAKPLQV